MKIKQVYLDYAAATPCDRKIIKIMEKIYSDFGNPSSIHLFGEKAKKHLENARNKVAQILNAHPEEIIFTSGGTESVNLAIQGVARAFKKSNKHHIISSAIEHHAVLNTLKYLEKEGFEVGYLKPEKNGIINPISVEKAVKKETFLITIMYVNNEIGTIQPIEEIGKIAKKRDIVFHTDACQAAGFCELNVKKLNVDLVSLNGNKIYGPRGIGCLYCKKSIPIKPLILGGGQEKGLRSGTENLPAICGFAQALENIQRNKIRESERLIKLRDYFIRRIEEKIPKAQLVGDKKLRLPNNVYFIFPGVKGEVLVRILSQKYGIFCSTASACSNINPEPSHVLLSLGYSPKLAQCGIRFSLGKNTTLNDINYVLNVLPRALQKAKEISPILL